MKTSVVEVTGTRVALPTTPLNSQTSRILYNDGSATVFLGDQNVEASGANKGIPLEAGKERVFGCSEKFLIYGITAGTAVNVIIGEAY